jgi:hypothetical protein
MWKVDPKKMCRQHLLGEHFEMHMFVGTIESGKSIKGYLEKGLVEIHNIEKRHNELVEEMIRRGYNHKSPLVFLVLCPEGQVDVDKNLCELHKRCLKCKGGG